MISFPKPRGRDGRWWFPNGSCHSPTPLYMFNFRDTKTICSSPTDHILPYVLFPGGVYHSIYMEYPPRKCLSFSNLSSRANFPLKPSLISSGRLRNIFPQKRSLPIPYQEPTSPSYPWLHSKNDFFKCLAQIQTLWKIRLVLFVSVYPDCRQLNRYCVNGSKMSKGTAQYTNIMHLQIANLPILGSEPSAQTNSECIPKSFHCTWVLLSQKQYHPWIRFQADPPRPILSEGSKIVRTARDFRNLRARKHNISKSFLPVL